MKNAANFVLSRSNPLNVQKKYASGLSLLAALLSSVFARPEHALEIK
jgi:hypothetical protein